MVCRETAATIPAKFNLRVGGITMKKEEYVLISELGTQQKERPGVFPVFKKIHRIDGQMIGEIQGYSDAFGNPLPAEIFEEKYDH